MKRGQFSAFFCIRRPVLYVCVVCMFMVTCACAQDLRLTLGVFLLHSPPWTLKQGHSLSPELAFGYSACFSESLSLSPMLELIGRPLPTQPSPFGFGDQSSCTHVVWQALYLRNHHDSSNSLLLGGKFTSFVKIIVHINCPYFFYTPSHLLIFEKCSFYLQIQLGKYVFKK